MSIEKYDIYSDSDEERIKIYTQKEKKDICKGCINGSKLRFDHSFDEKCGITCRTCKNQSHKKHIGTCLPGIRRRDRGTSGLLNMPIHCKLAFLSLIDKDECAVRVESNKYYVTQLFPSQKCKQNMFIEGATYILIGTLCDFVKLNMGKKQFYLRPNESLKRVRKLTSSDPESFRKMICSKNDLSLIRSITKE